MTREETRAHWRERLAAQQASGQSVVAWCAAQGVRRKDFYLWRAKLPAPPPAATAWVAVDVRPPVAPVAPVVPAPAGLTLQVGRVTCTVPPGFDPALLAAVLAVLEGRPC